MIYHWKSQGIDLFVDEPTEEQARATMKANVMQWRWQNPPRFDAVLQDLEEPAFFAAPPGHVITVDNKSMLKA